LVGVVRTRLKLLRGSSRVRVIFRTRLVHVSFHSFFRLILDWESLRTLRAFDSLYYVVGLARQISIVVRSSNTFKLIDLENVHGI
jgi:hypothetical protein